MTPRCFIWQFHRCPPRSSLVHVYHELLCPCQCDHHSHIEQARADYGRSYPKLRICWHGAGSGACFPIRNRYVFPTSKPQCPASYLTCFPVPAPIRGFVVGSYQLSLALGGLVINSICYGTSQLDDNRSWRIPLGLFYVVPSLIAATIFFIPESPRWLLRQNRTDEAKVALQKFRQGVFTEKEIEEEFHELQFALESEVEQGKFSELFKGVNLKRTLIVIFVNFFQQATGQAFASQYGAVYVRSLGIFNPMLFSVMSSGINSAVMILTLVVNDKVGRR